MATQAVTKREDTANNPVAFFQRQLEDRARDIQMALPAHITPDKFQRTVMTAVAQNPDLLKADRQSLILACYKAAQDALLPDGREAALVTFNTRRKVDGQWESAKLVQYMPMVYGLRKKILQSGGVVSLEVNVVYRAEVEKGTFLYEVGLEPPLRHRPSLDLSDEQMADEEIVAAYSIATMKDGIKSYEVMRRAEINKVRQTSQTGATGKTTRQGEPVPPKGPWVDWFGEMAKKTVMRRHAKMLPMSGDVLIDVEGRELETGMSAAAALSVTPDAPAIEDQTEETPHDQETGEVHEDEQNTQGESGTAREAPGASESTDAESGTASSPPSTEAEEMPTDELGITQDPAEAAGDKILQGFAKAETLIDLNKLKKEADKHATFMPAPIAAAIEGGYERHKKRLTQQEEPAQ